MTREDRITEVILFFLLVLTFTIGLSLAGVGVSVLHQADILLEAIVGIFLFILGSFMIIIPVYSVWQFVVIIRGSNE